MHTHGRDFTGRACAYVCVWVAKAPSAAVRFLKHTGERNANVLDPESRFVFIAGVHGTR